MNEAEIERLVEEHFAPRIREAGWTGSGFNYRKTEENHLVKVFGIQFNWESQTICCETAIHFDFLPYHDKIEYSACLIRERLTPNGEFDYFWELSLKENDNINIINEIWEVFNKRSYLFYESFEQFPHPFDNLTLHDFENLMNGNFKLLNRYYIFYKIDFIWLLTEINRFIGKQEIAAEFSRFGMNIVREWGATRKHGKIDEEYIDYYEKKFKSDIW